MLCHHQWLVFQDLVAVATLTLTHPPLRLQFWEQVRGSSYQLVPPILHLSLSTPPSPPVPSPPLPLHPSLSTGAVSWCGSPPELSPVPFPIPYISSLLPPAVSDSR